jgi:hypothetical protein
MLTAAEVGQMEVVPDLVFLNCCHLGTVDGQPAVRGVEYNKLASSLSRELIEMGVRVVVVAGWAVDDRAGQHFAEVFYRSLIDGGQPFGEAVHQARRETYDAFPTTNTWGAFQAYGDPGYLLDPVRSRAGRLWADANFVAPQELIDQLDQVRERLKRPGGSKDRTTLRTLERELAALLSRAPKAWAEQGDVQYAIGRVYSDFGEAGFDRACAYYLKAIEREEDAARVPIRAIEQLANMEARSGADAGDLDAIERGGRRMEMLTTAVAVDPGTTRAATAERCGVIGSAYKRMAAILASKAGTPGESFDQKAFRAALDSARNWYRKGEGEYGQPGFSPNCALNRLVIDALSGGKDTVFLADKAGEAAREQFRATRSYWDAMMPADAAVAKAMFAGTLENAQAPATVEVLAASYRQARSSVIEDARSWDSVVKQIEILATLADRMKRKALAESLRELARRLGPDAGVAPSGGQEPPPGKPKAPVARKRAIPKRADAGKKK